MRLFAYLDAGTGSLFIQAVIGIALAGTVFFRNFFTKIIRKVRLVFSRQPAANDKE